MKKSEIQNRTIGIIGGNGAMGKWFEKLFLEAGCKVLIADIDTDISNEEVAHQSDIVIVAAPLHTSVAVIESVMPYVRKDALLCDISGLKGPQMKMMRRAKGATLGMHPLFGPLTPSLSKQNIVFCNGNSHSHISELKDFFEEKGARVIEMDPEEHDRIMAYVQVLVHVSSIVFGKTILSVKNVLNEYVFTPAFRLQSSVLSRIFSGNGELFSYMATENPYTGQVLDNFEANVAAVRDQIERRDNGAYAHDMNMLRDELRSLLGMADHTMKKEIPERKTSNAFVSGGAVSFLGPRGTFSEEVVQSIGGVTESIPKDTITDVFQSVVQGESVYGVVPMQNSLGGLVSETLQSIITKPIQVLGSYELEVIQCLMGRTKKLEDIQTIYGHPQSLAQTHQWRKKNIPTVHVDSAASNTSAILEHLGTDVGFLGSALAAEKYDLEILAKNIQDNNLNATRFYLIASEGTDPKRHEVTGLDDEATALLISVEDRPAVLRDILDAFAKHGLNLRQLHSIPKTDKKWEYLFFMEIDIEKENPIFKDALKEVNEYCVDTRILGSV